MSIHPNTKIGAVSLKITNLEDALTFYVDRLGFSTLEQNADSATLGAGGKALLHLNASATSPAKERTTGLYHFAILVPSRIALAGSLRHIIQTQTPVQGFADHFVSEAIYLPDPDGNGIEIYRDRPQSEWPYKNNQLQMASDPLDLEGILNTLVDEEEIWDGLLPGTTIGHMHLQVPYLDEAEDFYHRVLGFDKIMRYGPSAAFLSAGGYHHHIGINTWAGIGAPPPPDKAAGLRWYELTFENQAALENCLENLTSHHLPIEEREGNSPGDMSYAIADPANNGIVLRARE